MFKFINPRLEIAHSRIRELELSNERLLTEVAFLREELTDSKQESKLLIDRIFDMTGVNKPVINQSIQVGQQPIQIGTKRLNWTNQRQTLEDRAKEVYYLNKNK
jgi:hypothetical protein